MRQILRRPVLKKLINPWRKRNLSSVDDPGAHDRLINAKELQFRQQPHPTLDKIIRANQAGERAAVMICAGQIAVLGKTALGNCIKHMETQEQAHVKCFENLVQQRRVRPSFLLPLWEFAGFALGATTAMLGKEAAMTFTAAVEDVIEQHYNSQLRQLLAEHHKEEELLQVISKCRDEEVEHKEIGLQNSIEQAPAHEALTQAIKMGCRLAIWVSERI